MRLLHTTSLELHEFFGFEIPGYAILSHRWEKGEISFQDVRDRNNLNAAGWCKIGNCCELARADGHEWVWIDTCCIDKTSSSELSEAINSMFRWYQDAVLCYAYLSDVSSQLMGREEKGKLLRKSQWFTRGWTLQELLAPGYLVFISRDWKKDIGTKWDLSALLSDITGIRGIQSLKMYEISVATRMSWASRRVCTRQEDEAYCLMGLFGVNMPLLYGEGAAAFKRLQLEILKDSDDESIFAWYPTHVTCHHSEAPSTMEKMLAQDPSDFEFSGDIRLRTVDLIARGAYAMTNKGLQLDATLYPIDGENGFFHLPLNCTITGADAYLAITLRAPNASFPFWTRVCSERRFELDMGPMNQREQQSPLRMTRENIFIRGREEHFVTRKLAMNQKHRHLLKSIQIRKSFEH